MYIAEMVWGFFVKGFTFCLQNSGWKKKSFMCTFVT